MTRNNVRLIGVVLAFAGGGTSLLSRDCITIGRWALAITVHDAATGAVLVDGVSIRTSGVEVDSIPSADGDTLHIGLNPGVYNVVVTKSGYKDFTKSNIDVTQDHDCHLIETVHFDVKLVRATE